MNEALIQPTERRVSCLGSRAPFTMAELLYTFFPSSKRIQLFMYLLSASPISFSVSVCLASSDSVTNIFRYRIGVPCTRAFIMRVFRSQCVNEPLMTMPITFRVSSENWRCGGDRQRERRERNGRPEWLPNIDTLFFFCDDEWGGTGSVSCANGFDVPHIHFDRHLIDDIASAAANVRTHCCAVWILCFRQLQFTIAPASPPLLPLLNCFLFFNWVYFRYDPLYRYYNEKRKRI